MKFFLNPDLVKIIEYSYEKSVKLFARNGVNLNYLTDEQAEALVKYKFAEITVSLDGTNQETYKIYRRNGDFDKVIKNIKKIIHYKDKYNSRFPLLTWKFIVFGHNEHEIGKVEHLYKEFGFDDFLYENNDTPSYSPLKNPERVRKLTGLNLDNNDENPIVRLKMYKQNKSSWFYCAGLWNNPQINWNGEILGCCANYSKSFGINAFEDGLLKALNNPKLIYAKNMLKKKAPHIEGLPCSDCFCYIAMKNEDEWL